VDLEANPPTPEQTLGWLRELEEKTIDMQYESRAEKDPGLRVELLKGNREDLAAIRTRIAELDPRRGKYWLELEIGRCYAGGARVPQSTPFVRSLASAMTRFCIGITAARPVNHTAKAAAPVGLLRGGPRDRRQKRKLQGSIRAMTTPSMPPILRRVLMHMPAQHSRTQV
jgi:hypothetical protein